MEERELWDKEEENIRLVFCVRMFVLCGCVGGVEVLRLGRSELAKCDVTLVNRCLYSRSYSWNLRGGGNFVAVRSAFSLIWNVLIERFESFSVVRTEVLKFLVFLFVGF